jgi:hypothetical protein
MAGSETVTANARVKATATYAFNLSAALLMAMAARLWLVTQFDGAALVWGLGALVLFAAGYGLLYLLEPEAEA